MTRSFVTRSGHSGGGRHLAAVNPPLCADQEHLRRLPRRASHRASIRCNAYQPGGCTSRSLFGYTGDGAGCVVYGLGTRFRAGRYHSWVVSKENFPDCLEITAEDVEEGQIMALHHREYDVRGIQFHPESVLTPKGKAIIRNWLGIN